MLYKRVLCIASGSALALSMCPVLISPLDVSADAGEFSGAFDYFSGFSSTEVHSVPGGAVVTGIMYALDLCTRNPIHQDTVIYADSLGVVTGQFVDGSDNSIHSGTICFPNATFYADESIDVFTSDLFNISVSPSSVVSAFYPFSSRIDVLSYGLVYHISPVSSSLGLSAKTYPPYFSDNFASGSPSSYPYDIKLLVQNSSVTLNPSSSLTSHICLGGRYTPGPIMGNALSVSMPSGSFTPATIDNYWSESVFPYIVNNYPECVKFIEAPYEPEYPDPSDFYPGIPKDWTIDNPQLPTVPDLDLQLPTADFDDLDPVEPITSNLSGVSFWWDLLETILDLVDVKAFWIAIAAIGLAVFVLWKLGG